LEVHNRLVLATSEIDWAIRHLAAMRPTGNDRGGTRIRALKARTMTMRNTARPGEVDGDSD
jgi:hypothetical protein